VAALREALTGQAEHEHALLFAIQDDGGFHRAPDAIFVIRFFICSVAISRGTGASRYQAWPGSPSRRCALSWRDSILPLFHPIGKKPHRSDAGTRDLALRGAEAVWYTDSSGFQKWGLRCL
jgi:hypothetical protein